LKNKKLKLDPFLRAELDPMGDKKDKFKFNPPSTAEAIEQELISILFPVR